MLHKKLLTVGYWGPGTDDDGVPYPQVNRFIIPGWYETHVEERKVILEYLRSGRVLSTYSGTHMCRVCGKHLSSRDKTDGIWQWPENLEHYVREHDVRPQPRFIEYVQKMLQVKAQPGLLPEVLSEKHRDADGVAHTAIILLMDLMSNPGCSEYQAFRDAYASLKQLSRDYEQRTKDSVDLYNAQVNLPPLAKLANAVKG